MPDIPPAMPMLVALSPVWVAALCGALLRLTARWSTWAALLTVPVALLAGTVALTLPFNLKAIGAPRVLSDHLLFVAFAGLGFALLSIRFRGRWTGIALAMLMAWWVAQAPPARPEFWRAGLVITIYAMLLVHRPPASMLVASLVGAATLWLVREPNWAMAALVGAAVSACVVGRAGPVAPAGAFLAAVMALATLASGRVMSGRLGPVEAAALAPLAAVAIWPWISRRWTRLSVRPTARVAVRRRRS